MRIYIKNLESGRGRKYILRLLSKEGLDCRITDYGILEIERDLTLKEICALNDLFTKKGLNFLIIDSHLTDRIRHAISNLISKNLVLRTSISSYVTDLFSIDYSYLDEYFKKETGISIEQYYLDKKKSHSYLKSLSALEIPTRNWNTSWWNFN
jgi:hypothetical protein